jgi:hypothetical protein
MIRHVVLVPNVNALGSIGVHRCIGLSGPVLHVIGSRPFNLPTATTGPRATLRGTAINSGASGNRVVIRVRSVVIPALCGTARGAICWATLTLTRLLGGWSSLLPPATPWPVRPHSLMLTVSTTKQSCGSIGALRIDAGAL